MSMASLGDSGDCSGFDVKQELEAISGKLVGQVKSLIAEQIQQSTQSGQLINLSTDIFSQSQGLFQEVAT